MSRGRHEAAKRRRAVAGVVLMSLWVATLLGATWAAADPPAVAGPPSADGVRPEIVDTKASSDRCRQLGFDHGLSFSGNGSASSDAMTVTISGFNSPGGFVAWSSTLPVQGVYVKGGPSGNLFSYPAGDTGDTDLHTPQKANGGFYGVGFVAVCWNDVPAPAEPDVTVLKTNEPPGAVEPGGTITYTLRVTNEGDANAAAVMVTDQLPAGVMFISATPGCNESLGTVTCGPADVDTGAAVDYSITVMVDEEHCGTIENTARVSASNEPEAAMANNVSETVTNDTVPCVARLAQLGPDLRVTKSSNATGPLHEGDKIVYTIAVTNVGDETANGVRLVDVLPVGATEVGGPFPFFGGMPCTVTSSIPSPTGDPHTEVQCGPVPIGAGQTGTVSITTTVTDDACGRITNNVDVEASNEPAAHVGAENHAEATDEIECPPRIRVVKSGPRRAHVGDTVTYVFKVRNIGGTALTDVELTDPGCRGPATLIGDGNGNDVIGIYERWRYTCDHTVGGADGDPVHSVARVTGAHQGGKVSDKDAHGVDVLHPGIRIEQSASPASGPPGSEVVYTYVVTNTGDATLFDISVDDTVGHVGDIDALAPGASATRSSGIVLGPSPITNVGTATGSDTLGMSVSDNDGATVAVVSGSGDDTGVGGSPFTGFGAGALGALAVALSAVGVALLALAGRRSPNGVDPSRTS